MIKALALKTNRTEGEVFRELLDKQLKLKK